MNTELFQDALNRLNQDKPSDARLRYEERIAFGPALKLDVFSLGNGLRILLLEEHSAAVLAFHSWFRVGSRHERTGKTGLAHLFEHLMFNETEHLPRGQFDRELEAVGAESNASTWLDFTQYNISAPKSELARLVRMEADRMENLILRPAQVDSEKEVVANERRFRVDDDVEGTINEVLYKTAFREHAYHWPTIGWMEDIEGFTPEDCAAFYQTYYAPNNAILVLVGDFETPEALRVIQEAYGHLPAAKLPVEDVHPEPPQTEQRRVTLRKPTPTEKLCIGYKGPALGDFDHIPLSLLTEILTGGRSSRLYRRLVRELEVASELRAFVGPFREPGLLEIYVAARDGHSAEAILSVIDEETERLVRDGVTDEEMNRTQARFELGLLHALESADGKAQTIGFYDCVLGEPDAAFRRLDALRRVTPSDLLRVARRYLRPEGRTVVITLKSEDKPSTAEVVQ